MSGYDSIEEVDDIDKNNDNSDRLNDSSVVVMEYLIWLQ